MDRNSPADYIEHSPEESLKDTKALIAYIRSLPTSSPHPLVYPILTPRFAISCTPELLSLLGDLACSDPTLHIQTHISENQSEVAFTKKLFPGVSTYAGVYDQFKLLRENTVLAHGIYLEEAEVRLIKERNAGISHCPTSNFNISSGIARVGELLDRGIKVFALDFILFFALFTMYWVGRTRHRCIWRLLSVDPDRHSARQHRVKGTRHATRLHVNAAT
jgi:guanine deaminase